MLKYVVFAVTEKGRQVLDRAGQSWNRSLPEKRQNF